MKSAFVLFGLLLALPAQANRLDVGKTLRDVSTLNYALGEGLLQTIVAKELCSCLFVAGLPDQEECLKRNKGDLDDTIFKFISVDTDRARKRVTVRPLLRIPGRLKAVATYNANEPKFGCTVKKERIGIL